MTRPPIPQAFELWEVVSRDLGLTWGAPRNLSALAEPLRPGEPGWIQRTAGGGGNGILIRNGPHTGRLVVPGYHGYPPPATAIGTLPHTNCTHAHGVAAASSWCNSGAGCAASPGPLRALRSGSLAAPESKEWRCYSPACLQHGGASYNASSRCKQYCTEDATIAKIVATCRIPPPPSPFTRHFHSHVLLSDDDGASWRLSKSFFTDTGEGSVAEVGSEGELIFVSPGELRPTRGARRPRRVTARGACGPPTVVRRLSTLSTSAHFSTRSARTRSHRGRRGTRLSTLEATAPRSAPT